MAYLENWQSAVPQLIQGNAELPPSVANLWPAFEVVSPQYPLPSVYNLMTKGYRADALVFACMDVRSGAISEPPLKIYKGKKDDKTEIEDHPARKLLERPNSEMGEMEFWKGVQIYMDAAGFSVWEVECNNGGDPIALWPMNPTYCSFLRGPRQPIRAVRYLVPGLPPVDVPRERLLIFQEFDPLYPWVRSLSRTAVALKEIGVRLSITDFLKQFFDHGTAINGVLTTTQSLTDAEAKRNRDRWTANHGGSQNWGTPAVLGNGLTYSNIQTSFKEMAFPEIDGRVEASICMAFRVSPIIVNAKIGLGVSSYNNREQADKAFTAEVRKPAWRYYSSEIKQQLLPFYGKDPGLYAEHDTSDVSALQEDEIAVAGMVEKLAARNLMYRDEGRKRMGLEPVDKGEKIFVGATVKAVEAPAATEAIMDPELDVAELRAEAQQTKEAASVPAVNSAASAAPGGQPTTQPAAAPAAAPKPDQIGPAAVNQPVSAEQFSATVKSYAALRRQALANIGQAVGAPFDAELVASKSGEHTRAVFAKHWPRKTDGRPARNAAPTGATVLAALERATAAAEMLA